MHVDAALVMKYLVATAVAKITEHTHNNRYPPIHMLVYCAHTHTHTHTHTRACTHTHAHAHAHAHTHAHNHDTHTHAY
jgi:pyridinium-3,5-bisthiocarboxylic acid mononucleotide nickel chelatase